MNEKKRKELFAEFDSLGEAKVRHLVEANTWSSHDPTKHSVAKEWLTNGAYRRAERADLREDEKTVISRKAYRMSVLANIIATIAFMVAVFGYF